MKTYVNKSIETFDYLLSTRPVHLPSFFNFLIYSQLMKKKEVSEPVILVRGSGNTRAQLARAKSSTCAAIRNKQRS
jgi:hypothetical protein